MQTFLQFIPHYPGKISKGKSKAVTTREQKIVESSRSLKNFCEKLSKKVFDLNVLLMLIAQSQS